MYSDRNVLDRLLSTRKLGVYAGIDPTAPSLHLGHLLPLMVLFWLSHLGHHTVSLVGGATARVGDPSGRLTSRAATAESVMDHNFQALSTQLQDLWDCVTRYGQRHGYSEEGSGRRELLNNAEWLNKLNILHFLKTVGNGMRVGAMLGRDTVKNKMEKGDGMSFSEFTYPLLQGWDWWHMYREKNIQIQIGGSDQYGNIIAGMDVVKHMAQHQANSEERARWLDKEGRVTEDSSPIGLTVPLLTTASGEKFGKSAGNAVWLDRNLTTPFDLYGFLLRSADADVERYLKLFTFLPLAQIRALMVEHAHDAGKRVAQHRLASEVLELVHGPHEAAQTRAEHHAMRTPTVASLRGGQHSSSSNDPTPLPAGDAVARQHTRLPKSLVYNTPLARILFHAGLVGTKSEGARLVAKGGVYVARPSSSSSSSSTTESSPELAFIPATELSASEIESSLVDGLLILRIGKWKVRTIEVVEDGDSGTRSP